MTTTLKAIVRKPRTDGLYAVYIRIVHNRKPGYIKTNKIVDADHISKENEPTDPVVNEYCSMLVRQYTDRLNRTNTSLWSVSEIIEYLLKTDEEVCFSEYARMFIRQMRADGHERNAKNYQLAVAHLERYMGTTRVMFGHLTAAVLKKWIKKGWHPLWGCHPFYSWLRHLVGGGLSVERDSDDGGVPPAEERQ